MQNGISKIFPGFSPALRHEIDTRATCKMVKMGQVVIRTGQHFRSVVLVVSGLIKVYRENDDGDRFFMYYLQPGQACVLSMIAASRKQASEITAKAALDTEIMMVPPGCMDDWMARYKSWYNFVLDNYLARFDELLRTIDQVAFRRMDDRLLLYIKRYRDAVGSDIMTINSKEIALELNSSREVITRLIKKLSDKGMIRLLKDHKIELLKHNTAL